MLLRFGHGTDLYLNHSVADCYSKFECLSYRVGKNVIQTDINTWSYVVSSVGDKDKMLHQIRRIGGQFGAIEGAIEQDSGCSYILQAIATTRGSLDSLLLKVIEEYVRLNVIEQGQGGDLERVKPAEEVIKLVQTYLR